MDPIDLALLIVVGSPAVGFLVGGGLRILRGHVSPPVVVGIALLLASPVAAGVLGPSIRVGIWDSALIGLLAGVGLIAGLFAWQDHPGGVLLGFMSLVLTLGAAELLVRALLPHPPGFPAAGRATIFLPPIDLDHPVPAHGDFAEFHRQAIDGCSMLYPERYQAYVEERAQREGSREGSVVYLGDSMTYGLGVRLNQAFPAVLEQRTPTLFHFNLGFPGTSEDYHYIVAKHWIPLLEPPVKLVVLGLYYNDILELGQGMPCCQNHSVVTFESGAPAERCPEPSWVPGYGTSIDWFLIHSPPPYPLRVAMEYSHLARYAGAILYRNASQAIHSDRPRGEEAVWNQMGQILSTLRDELAARKIPLVAIVLPIRASLEAENPTDFKGYENAQRLKELSASLGVRTLDSADHFRPLVKRDGSSRYFLGSDDIHLTPEGHIEMAEWLIENVPEIRAAATAAGHPPAEEHVTDE